MRLFYDSNIAPDAREHTLSEDESKHVIRVLRMSEGDAIGLLDGKGRTFHCKISHPHPKKCILSVTKIDFEPKPLEEIHIAVAPTKQMERIEWFIEKAVEIGVTKITLLDCKNGERARIKLDRLQKKAISAMKQSHRKHLPEVHDLTSFSSFIESHSTGLIAHCYDGKKSNFETAFKTQNCPILIGPEGDFTTSEVDQALEKGYKTITLGENRLRTETAALYSCMRAKIQLDQ